LHGRGPGAPAPAKAEASGLAKMIPSADV